MFQQNASDIRKKNRAWRHSIPDYSLLRSAAITEFLPFFIFYDTAVNRVKRKRWLYELQRITNKSLEPRSLLKAAQLLGQTLEAVQSLGISADFRLSGNIFVFYWVEFFCWSIATSLRDGAPIEYCDPWVPGQGCKVDCGLHNLPIEIFETKALCALL